MHTYIIGKNTKKIMSKEQCPGIEITHLNMMEEELGHMCCRMQKEMHFIYVLRGAMVLQINQERVEVYRGEGLFINSNTMYRFAGGINDSCELYLFTLSEDVITDDKLFEKYINPIRDCIDFPYMKLTEREEESGKILEQLVTAGRIAEENRLCYELEVKSGIYQSLAALFRGFEKKKPVLKKAVHRETDKLRRMLVYLHENYKNKITLTEIAENLGVSSGDYCRFFKKHMGQTPFEYLQTYRIEMSIPELLEKADSITEISLRHGFNGSSYYAETFRKEMGCTPGDYRKWYLDLNMKECPLKLVQVGNVQQETQSREEAPLKRKANTMPTHLL